MIQGNLKKTGRPGFSRPGDRKAGPPAKENPRAVKMTLGPFLDLTTEKPVAEVI